MLSAKLVELTAEMVNPRMFIWKIRSMKVPDAPAMAMKAERTDAMSSGGNYMFSHQMPEIACWECPWVASVVVKTAQEKLKCAPACSIHVNEVISHSST